MLRELQKALFLDRLCERLGLTGDVDSARRFRATDMVVEEIETLSDRRAEMRAKTLFRQRQQAIEFDRQNPGYREELNKQRARCGLPEL